MTRGHDFSFTSESVSEGHPDKLADQISDAVVDAHLAQDSAARCAVETLVTKNLIVLAGEVTSRAEIDAPAIARKVCRDVGYTSDATGFDSERAEVRVFFKKQSEDIARAMDPRSRAEGFGAGDQAVVFGYATNETAAYMPLPIMLAHGVIASLQAARRSGIHPFLRPDAKAQVTVRYRAAGHPVHIDTVVVSTQHTEAVSQEVLRQLLLPTIRTALPGHLFDHETEFLINPAGRFVIGGPASDTGLTGRKQQVDTYGGMCRHGGAGFSGKDPSKIDRSASYMARYIAKNIVAAHLAERVEVQLAYAIGLPQPIVYELDLFDSGSIDVATLLAAIPTVFDLSAQGIVTMLDLTRHTFLKTACGGHFGRSAELFSWERTDKADELARKLR